MIKTKKPSRVTTTKEEAKSSLTKHIIALKKGFITVSDAGIDNRITASTVQAHLMQYKYMLDQDAFEALGKADLSEIVQFHDEVIAYLKKTMGGEGFEPLYRNFPQEVMSKSLSELYWNAMLHYWTGGKWEPSSKKVEKELAFENIKYNILKFKDLQGFLDIFPSLVSVNTSLTVSDLDVVKWFVESGMELKMPEKIPFKENLMTLAGMGLDVPIKTPTDVLRIAVHMSGGDISLPSVPNKYVKAGTRYSRTEILNEERNKFKFKKFSRKDRRYLLGMLEKVVNASEMVLKDQRWVRLGEILHPGEYKNQFPKCYGAFTGIRGGDILNGRGKKKKKIKIRSWYSKLEKLLYKDLNLEEGLKYLSQRPGEFVRRIDFLVRTYTYDGNLTMIMDYFREACKNASNKVLFELYTHFEKRANPTSGRSVFIKGARKKTPLKELPALSLDIIEGVHRTIFSALQAKFEKLPKLGNCWIDEDLKNIPLPTNMRSLNPALKPTIRGQRIPFDNPNAKVIRPFIHWNGGHGGTDLDLSATFVGANHGKGIRKYGTGTATISFSSLRTEYALHSGDVRRRAGKCAEYIDIAIHNAFLKHGYKYVVLDVRDYNRTGLKSHGAVFGLMEREHPEYNNTWLPETISNCQELNSIAQVTMIAILDLETKEYIMLDLDSDGSVVASRDLGSILQTIKDFANPPKVSVYDLILMHVQARGKQVNLDNNVDVMFKAEDFMNDYTNTCSYMGV